MKSKPVIFFFIVLLFFILFTSIIYFIGGYSLLLRFESRTVNFIVHTYTRSYFYILILFLSTIACLLFEWLDRGWENSSLKKIFIKPGKSVRNDLVSYFLILTQLHVIIGYGFSFGLALLFSGFFKPLFDFKLIADIPYPIVQFLLVFLLIDFLDYWVHRLEHNLSFLWMTHKFHHSSEEFTFISAKRVHPFNDISLKRTFFVIPMAILGTPIQAFLAFEVFRQILSLIQHSDYKWGFGWIGKFIIISPKVHRIHHSMEESHYNANYGTIFIWWDRLFKTYYTGETPVTSIGIKNCDHNKRGYLENVITTYFELCESLFISVKNKLKSANPVK